MEQNQQVERAVCLGSRVVKKKDGSGSFAIMYFFLDTPEGGDFVDYVNNDGIPLKDITSFHDLVNGDVKVGDLTTEHSIYRRKKNVRFVSFKVS